MSSIKPSDHLSEQCHGPTKISRPCNARQSCRLPLLSPRLLPSPLAGQQLRQPTRTTASQGKPDWCLVQYCGQSRIVPHCERQAAVLRTRTCSPTFLHHAATAKLPGSPTSIYHPWSDRTSMTIWLRPLYIFATAAPPTTCLYTPYPSQWPAPPLTLNRNDNTHIRTRIGKPKARYTTPRECCQSHATSRIRLLGG